MPMYTDQNGDLVEARQCRPELRMDIQHWSGIRDRAINQRHDEDWVVKSAAGKIDAYADPDFEKLFTPVQ